MGKPRNTRKYPTYPEIPEIPGNTRKKKIPGNTRSYFLTLLPDPNPTRFPVFCPIPDPTRPDIEKPYLLGTACNPTPRTGTKKRFVPCKRFVPWFTLFTLLTLLTELTLLRCLHCFHRSHYFHCLNSFEVKRLLWLHIIWLYSRPVHKNMYSAL